VDHPRWAHERCIDWGERDFPGTKKLPHLRTLARSLLRAHRVLLELGLLTAQTAQSWPDGAPDVLSDIRASEQLLRDEIRDLRRQFDRLAL